MFYIVNVSFHAMTSELYTFLLIRTGIQFYFSFPIAALNSARVNMKKENVNLMKLRTLSANLICFGIFSH